MLQRLKLNTEFYEDSLRNTKTFEVRRNDRGFKTGDILTLWEWDDDRLDYTGRHHEKVVTYIFAGRDAIGLKPGYVILGTAPVRWEGEQ